MGSAVPPALGNVVRSSRADLAGRGRASAAAAPTAARARRSRLPPPGRRSSVTCCRSSARSRSRRRGDRLPDCRPAVRTSGITRSTCSSGRGPGAGHGAPAPPTGPRPLGGCLAGARVPGRSLDGGRDELLEFCPSRARSSASLVPALPPAPAASRWPWPARPPGAAPAPPASRGPASAASRPERSRRIHRASSLRSSPRPGRRPQLPLWADFFNPQLPLNAYKLSDSEIARRGGRQSAVCWQNPAERCRKVERPSAPWWVLHYGCSGKAVRRGAVYVPPETASAGHQAPAVRPAIVRTVRRGAVKYEMSIANIGRPHSTRHQSILLRYGVSYNSAGRSSRLVTEPKPRLWRRPARTVTAAMTSGASAVTKLSRVNRAKRSSSTLGLVYLRGPYRAGTRIPLKPKQPHG